MNIKLQNKIVKNVIILGSGRSGTSLLAGILSSAGYYMGNNYLAQNQSNPKGFFEDYEVNTINEDILNLVIPHCPELLRKNFFPSMTYYRARWLARLNPNLEMKTNSVINNRIRKIISMEPFCYKDPRFSYTLPIWNLFLIKKNTVLICVFREPFNTAESIVKECRDSKALHSLKMNHTIALEVWMQVHESILKHYEQDQHQSRWLFVHFEQILNGEALNKISLFTRAKVDQTFVDKTINRTRLQHQALPWKIERIYQKLCSLASFKKEP